MKRFSELAQRIEQATGRRQTPEQVAADSSRLRSQHGRCIKRISVQRGHDVTDTR